MEKTMKAVEVAKKTNNFIKDPILPDDEDEIRWWVFDCATYEEEDVQETEDGVEATSVIRPEDAMELGGAQGLFSLPPVAAGQSEDLAKDFHATLNAWPKAKAKTRTTPPDGEPAARLIPTTPAEQLHNLVKACDADVAYLEKTIRTCQADPDAATCVGQCKLKVETITSALVHMRSAERDANMKSMQITAQFVTWADAVTSPSRTWVEKNKRVCNLYITAQVPEHLKSAAKKKKEKESCNV